MELAETIEVFTRRFGAVIHARQRQVGLGIDGE
jgi:hypothetical protein